MSEVAVLTVEKYVPVRKKDKTLNPESCKENCLKCKKEKIH